MPNRPYTSPARERQAHATRLAILRAATELFVDQGYGPTPISAIAQRAEVSVQTVYNAFGTKPALLKAAYDLTLAGDDAPLPLAERPEVKRLYALPDPVAFLHGYAELGRSLLDRLGPLSLRIAAGAAAGDPDLIDHQRITDEERLVGTMFAARRVRELDALAPDLTIERARDRLWTLNSVQVWHLLTATRGWSSEEYASWIGDAMCAAVLAPPTG
ncbi:MAG TPA: helix-turn-helix domain-containing protein [Pseudonocardia sp.]|nr:helix-turn-helix domain-containing protein [Pseudonocardia sp.]